MCETKLVNNKCILRPDLKFQGKVVFNEGRARIYLKKPVRDLLVPFETDNRRVGYLMEFCKTKEKLMETIEMLDESEALPILFYLVKGKLQDD